MSAGLVETVCRPKPWDFHFCRYAVKWKPGDKVAFPVVIDVRSLVESKRIYRANLEISGEVPDTSYLTR